MLFRWWGWIPGVWLAITYPVVCLMLTFGDWTPVATLAWLGMIGHTWAERE
jgi:hypothetical protein